MGAARGSFLGKFFRRLADFFDGGTATQAPSARGTRLEVDIITLAIVFLGLVSAGTWIHGWSFIFWNIAFAVLFCAGVWLIFYSSRFKLQARAFLICLVLLISMVAATERIMALAAFVLLFLLVLKGGFPRTGDFFRRETLSVVTVALFCFSSYDAFAGILEWRRSAALSVAAAVALDCKPASVGTVCKAGDVAFSVPEFWTRGPGSNLIQDLRSVAQLRIYADGATDNSVAFAAFSAPANQVMRQVQVFLSAQKGFLRSKSANKEPLAPKQIMKSPDTALFGVQYESIAPPGYLAETKESMALILTHERRGITWLFIIDGTEVQAREFLLHRIISGFH